MPTAGLALLVGQRPNETEAQISSFIVYSKLTPGKELRSDDTHPTTSSPLTRSKKNRRFHPCWNEAIITLKKATVPKEVTLRGHPDGSPQIHEITVPIRGVQLKDSEPRLPTLIQILAASRLIDEHDKSRAPLPYPIDLLPVAPDGDCEVSIRLEGLHGWG
ncbi:hypothetical protein PM082_016685 [Marasmius tenuissimus]|nr:hypothetical protein PM082_016685 [Marasmius tenuissimus]